MKTKIEEPKHNSYKKGNKIKDNNIFFVPMVFFELVLISCYLFYIF